MPEFNSDTEGASLLELTIVLPVLLTIGLGMLEFGNLLYNYHLIAVGIRDAGRWLSGVPLTTANEGLAANIATTGVIAGGTNRISWWDAADVTFTPQTVANDDGVGNKLYRGGNTVTLVTVSTSVTYQPLGYLGYLGLSPITLTASHEERVYGNR